MKFFLNANHIKKFYTDKLAIINKMDEANMSYKLFELDEKFSELLYDMKSVVVSGEEVDSLVSEYRKFIEKYK